MSLPKIPNAHSHAFQYAMAGKSEYLSADSPNDDFWSWRKKMYELALSISPEEMQKVATQLYKDMVHCGYDSVAEFHYLHHQPNGKPYDNSIEMAERLIAAANEAGIQITLVPVFYQTASFGKPALEHQRRFLFQDVEDYLKYHQKLKSFCADKDFAKAGCGVHSLRAAPLEAIQEIAKLSNNETPFHIHISEQTKEVEDCLEHYKARPVKWLFDQIDIGENFHLVHATHIDEDELDLIVQHQANVVLCPSTEANLGDGIFPLTQFHHKGGRWCIGSDSHVCRNPYEELRWLEYTQRLVHQKRNPLCTPGGPNSAQVLVQSAIENGRRACGQKAEFSLSMDEENLSEKIFADINP